MTPDPVLLAVAFFAGMALTWIAMVRSVAVADVSTVVTTREGDGAEIVERVEHIEPVNILDVAVADAQARAVERGSHRVVTSETRLRDAL